MPRCRSIATPWWPTPATRRSTSSRTTRRCGGLCASTCSAGPRRSTRAATRSSPSPPVPTPKASTTATWARPTVPGRCWCRPAAPGTGSRSTASRRCPLPWRPAASRRWRGWCRSTSAACCMPGRSGAWQPARRGRCWRRSSCSPRRPATRCDAPWASWPWRTGRPRTSAGRRRPRRCCARSRPAAPMRPHASRPCPRLRTAAKRASGRSACAP